MTYRLSGRMETVIMRGSCVARILKGVLEEKRAGMKHPRKKKKKIFFTGNHTP